MKFDEARACVIERVTAARVMASSEQVALDSAAGRVLAENILADRDSPALARSVRDGFAVHAEDVPGTLRVIGEVRAGERFDGDVGPRRSRRDHDRRSCAARRERGGHGGTRRAWARRLRHYRPRRRTRTVHQSARVRSARRRSSAHPRQAPGLRRHRLARGGGQERELPCIARPRVALLATGDEIVAVTEKPRDFQIRNSNVYSLAAQVARAGGVPEILPVAKDEYEDTRRLVERGLASDLLLISGGVSAGKVRHCGARARRPRRRVLL